MGRNGGYLLGWWGKSLAEMEESKLLFTEKIRSGGIGTPETMYLNMRAWCSSSCHWVGVKGEMQGFGPEFIILESRTKKRKEKWERKEEKCLKRSKVESDEWQRGGGYVVGGSKFLNGYFCKIHRSQKLVPVKWCLTDTLYLSLFLVLSLSLSQLQSAVYMTTPLLGSASAFIASFVSDLVSEIDIQMDIRKRKGNKIS